jgi:hypothetical protein
MTSRRQRTWPRIEHGFDLYMSRRQNDIVHYGTCLYWS